MNLKSTLTLALAIVTRFASADVLPDVRKAQTAEERKPSVGFLLGYSDTEHRRQGTTFGVDYLFQPTIPFSLGGEVLAYESHGDENGEHGTLTRTRVLVKSSYNLGGTIPVIKNTYVSLGLGPVFDNETGDLQVSLGIAPSIGFDILLPGTRWSAGANASYTAMAFTGADGFFSANGVLKYWY